MPRSAAIFLSARASSGASVTLSLARIGPSCLRAYALVVVKATFVSILADVLLIDITIIRFRVMNTDIRSNYSTATDSPAAGWPSASSRARHHFGDGGHPRAVLDHHAVREPALLEAAGHIPHSSRTFGGASSVNCSAG